MRALQYILAIIGLLTLYEFARPYVLQLLNDYRYEVDDAKAKIEERKRAGRYYDLAPTPERGPDWRNPEVNDWRKQPRR